MVDFDHDRVSRTVAAALAGPGGIALVVNVFAGLPGVAHTPARRGLFRSSPERIQIGDWRYEVAHDGRLMAAHVVNGVVIAEEMLLPRRSGRTSPARWGRSSPATVPRSSRHRCRAGRVERQRGVSAGLPLSRCPSSRYSAASALLSCHRADPGARRPTRPVWHRPLWLRYQRTRPASRSEHHGRLWLRVRVIHSCPSPCTRSRGRA